MNTSTEAELEVQAHYKINYPSAFNVFLSLPRNSSLWELAPMESNSPVSQIKLDELAKFDSKGSKSWSFNVV